MQATIQLCTYNRSHLLGRVLEACFEQSAPSGSYEVVLVNDGSSDGTPEVIAQAQSRATAPFTVINQANAGLARGRNAGIEAAKGERIIFIDDDVLPTPHFVAGHLATHAKHPADVIRGAVINTETFDDLPPPIYSLKHYSGNFFWTSNVSVPLATIRDIGGFNTTFSEYGWEDIDVGLRLRARGLQSILNPQALAFHYKPRPRTGNVEGMIRQARAQARTAVQLAQLHPQWRSYLATGNTAAQRLIHKWIHGIGASKHFTAMLGDLGDDRPLGGTQLWAARRLVADAYFEELERARAHPP
ncbi:MAG: glycosyltransferase [Candidatus Eremiobacteraeota bacterium]|nr:glycosyltransferase [Candidatus Eremiobacteraeota bacterium]